MGSAPRSREDTLPRTAVNRCAHHSDLIHVGAQIWPDTYGSVKCIHRGASSEVFAAKRLEDDFPVVLKILEATPQGNERARREFNAIRVCQHPGIPEAFALDLSCERPCLVLERLPGISLNAWLEASGPPPIGVTLSLAITWADILSAVHAARMLHRDVTPNNLLIDPETYETHLIDFGITAGLGTAAAAPGSDPEGAGWAGTLQYMAPEQSGRMNRRCSFHSDLYGFGATLYYALTGRPPFLFADPLELIHAHIARQPLPPSEIRAQIPQPLSRLVLKLLGKEPEERYASANSLRCDLMALRAQWEASGQMDSSFRLEAIQVPDRPRYPTKLYGRERECDALAASIAAASSSRSRVVSLEGPAGVGKSALVDSLRSRLGEMGAYLVQGAFDAYGERPHSAWIACLESFAEQLLIESDDRLAQWRREIRASLGSIAGALTEWVPDLGTLLGDVAPVPPLGPSETRARLLLALQRFLAAAGTPAHPLAIFLDELQHADFGSQFLLQEIFAAETQGNFVIILACQVEGEETPAPLSASLQRLSDLDVPVDRIELGALSPSALLEFLEDTLDKPRDMVAPLAMRIEQKTGCNPLCVRQLIDHWHAQGLIAFEPGAGWHWDLDAIAGASVPDGAIGLLIAKLESLPDDVRNTLSRASCATSVFGRPLLERLTAQNSDSIQANLLELERQGLVLPLREGFRIAHDRIRDAARVRLSEEERSILHAEVASYLLEEQPEDERDEHAFEIADHLVRAGGSLPRELLSARIELCLTAGREAQRAGAPREARRYLDVARGEFAPTEWDTRHALGMQLWLACADSTFQAGDPQRALELLAEVEPHISTDLERAQVEMQRITVLNLVQSPADCVRHALSVLRRFGIRWPLHPSLFRSQLSIRRIYARVAARARLGIHAPGGTLPPRHLAALMIINAAGGAMARTDSRLTAIATCFVIKQPMPKTMGSREANSIGSLALWIQCLLGDAKRSAALAGDAHAWIKASGDTIHAARFELVLRGCLHPMQMQRRRAIAGLEPVAEQLIENGDVEWAYYGRFLKSAYGMLAGDPVAAAREQMASLVEIVHRAGHQYPAPERCLRVYDRFCDTERATVTLDEAVRESRSWLSEHPGSPDVWELTFWTMVLCVYQRHDLLWEVSQSVYRELFRKLPYAQVADHLLYRGIAAADLAARTRKRCYTRGLREASKLLLRWATYGPDFSHMLLLLHAEEARLRGKLDRAHRLYEQAARGALGQEFVHHAALAKERCAGLLLEGRRAVEARRILTQALQLYESWGAQPKLQQLRGEHAALLDL